MPNLVSKKHQGLAYALLFAQQQAMDPSITVVDFQHWLEQTVKNGAAAAKSAVEKKQKAEGKQ